MSSLPRSATTMPPSEVTKARRALRLAWLSLGLLPVSWVAAMILGDWLVTAQGYESGAEDIEFGAAVKAGIPAMLVLISPTLLTMWFALRVKHYGHPAWKDPMIVAAVVATASVFLNLVQLVAALLGAAVN